MSLLTLIQSATDKIGLTRPSVVYASTDQQVRELLNFANQEGVELARAHQWQEITKEKTFTTTAAAVQAGAFASDFDRIVNYADEELADMEYESPDQLSFLSEEK